MLLHTINSFTLFYSITIVLFFLQSVVANICSYFSPTTLVQTQISKQLLDKLAMKCGFHSFMFVELLLTKIWLYNQIPPKTNEIPISLSCTLCFVLISQC